MRKIYATGKRKTSVAKVWLQPGSGKITVNGLSLDAWLGGLEAKKKRVLQPLILTEQQELVDITYLMNKNHVFVKDIAYQNGVYVMNVYSYKESEIPSLVKDIADSGFAVDFDEIVYKDKKYNSQIRIKE